MKKILVFCFIVILCVSVYSQDYKFEATFSPVSLIDPTHPAFRGEVEYYFLKKVSVGIDAGYGTTLNYKLSALAALSRNFTKYNFYQIRPN